MTAGIVPAAFFCLGTGAALGVLFLLVKAVGLALRGGRLYTFLSDLAFGILCGAVVLLWRWIRGVCGCSRQRCS